MSLPQEFVDRLEKQFGHSGCQLVLRGLAFDRPTSFRTNTLVTTDDAVMAALRENQVMFSRVKEVPHAFTVRNITNDAVHALSLNQEGKIYVQGLTSMLPPLVLDPKPGETVLDLCAAPGSKTTQMAAMMGNVGKIIACEENSIRHQKLMNTLRIQGATMVEAREMDAGLLHHDMTEAFDKVLADVPCSAEGRMQVKDKRSYGFWSQKNIIAHAKLQRRLLRSAVACLKPGGTLVYSTCTLAPEENEDMIDWLVTEFPVMVPQAVTLPFLIKAGKHKTATLFPTKDYEGFFVAKLTKKA